jgi:hypothetical protein
MALRVLGVHALIVLLVCTVSIGLVTARTLPVTSAAPTTHHQHVAASSRKLMQGTPISPSLSPG